MSFRVDVKMNSLLSKIKYMEVFMQKIMSHLHFRSIYKILVITLLLCFAYNVAYLMIMAYSGNVYLKEILQILLSLLSAVGFYWICTRVWKTRKINHKDLLYIFFLQAIYIVIVNGILTNLVNIFSTNTLVMIVLQLISALCLVCMIPFQLLYYYGLSHDMELKSFLKTNIKKHQKNLLNWYCTLLIGIIICDTLGSGLFSAASGFNAQSILVGSMYMGNPMMSWMMYLYLGVSLSASLSSMFTYLFVNFLMGFVYCIFELNYVCYVKRVVDAD